MLLPRMASPVLRSTLRISSATPHDYILVTLNYVAAGYAVCIAVFCLRRINPNVSLPYSITFRIYSSSHDTNNFGRTIPGFVEYSAEFGNDFPSARAEPTG